MTVGQRSTKKHAEQGTSEDARERDATDGRGTHDPSLLAVAVTPVPWRDRQAPRSGSLPSCLPCRVAMPWCPTRSRIRPRAPSRSARHSAISEHTRLAFAWGRPAIAAVVGAMPVAVVVATVHPGEPTHWISVREIRIALEGVFQVAPVLRAAHLAFQL